MKISSINNNVSFKAGNTRILSDFDGTFMPKEFNHDSICNNNPPVDRNKFTWYFNRFYNFLHPKDESKKPELTISTGRNLHEFNYYMKEIKDRGLAIPVPDKLIITNGGDEFIRPKDREYFETPDVEMFSSADLNKQKYRQMSRYLLAYSPEIVKPFVRNYLAGIEGAKIMEPLTHQGTYGYRQNYTLQEQVENGGNFTNFVSLRDDGNMEIRLTAPTGSPYWEQLRQLPQAMFDAGFEVESQIIERDGETCVNSVFNPQQWEQGTNIDMKPKTFGKVKVLDKFHHAKYAVDEIRKGKTDDLVIVCGDGKNDFSMLNLSNYIDKMPTTEDFTNPKYKDEVDKLPIISIFVLGDHALDEQVSQYERIFNFDGNKRFITVNPNDPSKPPTLLDAILLAQEEYAKRNENYKRNK